MKRSCFLDSIPAFMLFFMGLLAPSISSAQWEPPFCIVPDSALLPFGNGRGIAAGENGTVHTVWWIPDIGGWIPGEIYYAHSTDYGATWSQEVQLSANVGGWTDCPTIAASGPYVHTIWEDGDGMLYYRRSTDCGATWSNQVCLSGTTPWAHMPSIAACGSSVHAVWADRRNGGGAGLWFIYYRRSTDHGATWSQEDSLTFAETDYYEDPRPSVSASDSCVYLTWQDLRDVHFSHEIYFRRSLDNGTTWSADTRLTTGAYSWYFTPRPAIGSAGPNVHIVWEDTLGDGSTCMHQYLYYMRSTDQGATWSSWVQLLTDTTYAEQATVTAVGSKVHVACMALSPLGSTYGIFYRSSSDNGTTWSQDTMILPLPDSTGYDHPSIAASETDTLVHLVFGNGNLTDGGAIYYSRKGDPPVGVEAEPGSRLLCSGRQYEAVPNPFVSFTSMPDCLTMDVALYDIAGRMVGVYRGNRIGEGLSAGVYFIKLADGSGTSIRIVKVH